MVATAAQDRKCRAGLALSCLALGATAWTSVRADVIDISPSGTIVTYKGPTQFVGATSSSLDQTLEVKAIPNGRISALSQRSAVNMHPVLAGYANEAAEKFKVDPALIQAVAWQESRFNPYAVSPKGAIGIMQLMPATARQLGVNPHDPRENIQGGVAYLSALLTQFGGDVRLALAAYNAGPEAVRRYGGIPPFRETQSYVKSIAERVALR